MNTEQERADFEAWANGRCELHLVNPAGRYSSATTQFAWEAYQAGRAALQSQATEAFPCRIVEADFETGTVTLKMHGKYTVSGGQKYLCDAPMQSQDRQDAERYRWLRRGGNDDIGVVRGFDVIEYGSSSVASTYEDRLCGDRLDAAIDHARRVEGES